jgi:hypothetical protein
MFDPDPDPDSNFDPENTSEKHQNLKSMTLSAHPQMDGSLQVFGKCKKSC